jgi:hypothetical protein
VKLRLFAPLLAAVAAAPLLLTGCGGSSDDGPGYVRLVNATSTYASLDLYDNDTKANAAVATNTVGDYTTIGSGSYTFYLKPAGSSTAVASAVQSVSDGVHNTLVAYNTSGSLRTRYLSDNEAAPTSGTAKFRVFNTSYEAGNVDVYVTAPTDTLTNATPNAPTIGGERFSTYGEITAGTYRIRVTAAGDETDVRLDIPSVTLTDQQILTLVLTSTPGGVLVNGLLINQQGTLQAQVNGFARVRLVAGASASGTVAATVNGINLSSGTVSTGKPPAIGSYLQVPAGALATSVSINGTDVSPSGLTAAPGADLTLLVLGSAAAPQVALISDDNSPALTSGYVKLRLINGVNGLNSALTLQANNGVLTKSSNIAFGTAGDPTQVINSTTASPTPLEVDSATSSSALYTGNVALLTPGVYTLFMLGDAAAPSAVLRLDR